MAVSPLLADMAARVQRAMAPLASDVILRSVAYWNAKAAVLAPVGATAVSINTLPAGLDRVLVGDIVSSTAPTRTITAEVIASGGVITAAPFALPLTAQIAAGALVQITRNTDTVTRGIESLVDLSNLPSSGSLVQMGDYEFTLLADTVPVTPTTLLKIVNRAGRQLNIISVSQDAAAGAWKIIARG